MIGALPDTPETAMVHFESEYSVKVTDPVGAAAPVVENVAVSDTVILVPNVPSVGFAIVVIVGEAGPTTISSLASPHLVVDALLLASPA
jgi:hypothetical protein